MFNGQVNIGRGTVCLKMSFPIVSSSAHSESLLHSEQPILFRIFLDVDGFVFGCA